MSQDIQRMFYTDATGASTPTSAQGNSAVVAWPGGRGEFAAWAGTWGGATATLQCQLMDGTWLAVDSGSDTYCTKTANGHGGFELPSCNLRVVVSAASPTNLQASVRNSQRVF